MSRDCLSRAHVEIEMRIAPLGSSVHGDPIIDLAVGMETFGSGLQ